METILIGDALQKLQTMETGSIHTCVTSPPYYNLRDYGTDGQIGAEDTPGEFVENLVAVFREVRRVLRPDGTLWVNIGDSYATRSGKQPPRNTRNSCGHTEKRTPAGYKYKDLMGIPWMLAFALRADGWYLRQDIIWSKTNPMPESVRDRCTKTHEYVFYSQNRRGTTLTFKQSKCRAERKETQRLFEAEGHIPEGDRSITAQEWSEKATGI